MKNSEIIRPRYIVGDIYKGMEILNVRNESFGIYTYSYIETKTGIFPECEITKL